MLSLTCPRFPSTWLAEFQNKQDMPWHTQWKLWRGDILVTNNHSVIQIKINKQSVSFYVIKYKNNNTRRNRQ